MNHANLPSVVNAKLPAAYERARESLATCERIDECKAWADKAEALASYAKQAGDDTLRRTADKIQARAIQRCGELLKAIQRPAQGGRPKENGTGAGTVSRREAARDAGLSKRQQVTATRVANVPEAEFKRLVETDRPATVTALAERGKRVAPVVVDFLKGRNPADFAAATQAGGALQRFAEMADRIKPAAVVRGSSKKEHHRLASDAKRASTWLQQLLRALEDA